MLKINIFFIFITAIVLFSFFVKKEKRTSEIFSSTKKDPFQTSLNNEDSLKESEKNLKLESEENLKLESKKSPSRISSLTEQISSDTEPQKDKALKESQVLFKTSDEVFDTYFPNIEKQFPNSEKEFGLTARDRYKRILPVSFMLRIKTLTEEQRQKYKRIVELEQEDYRSFSKDKFIISDTNSGELETMMDNRTIVKDYYTPQYMNILTKEQQIELVKHIQSFLDRCQKSSEDKEKNQ
jgi:hypothetical protein